MKRCLKKCLDFNSNEKQVKTWEKIVVRRKKNAKQNAKWKISAQKNADATVNVTWNAIATQLKTT